jgi:hypothetical protein
MNESITTNLPPPTITTDTTSSSLLVECADDFRSVDNRVDTTLVDAMLPLLMVFPLVPSWGENMRRTLVLLVLRCLMNNGSDSFISPLLQFSFVFCHRYESRTT